MGTREFTRMLNTGQKAALTGSEYIASVWARGTALNYPVVGIQCSSRLVPLFIEKISYSMTAAQLEVYGAVNIAALAAASNSSIRLFGKKQTNGNASIHGSMLFGEITPAQYSALIFGEDLYTRKVTEGVFDFTDSNIMLLNPSDTTTSSILVAGIGAATELFVSFDIRNIHSNNN